MAFSWNDPRKYQFGTATWFSGSVLTDPGNDDVIVDTGQLAAGNYLIAISGAGSVDWVYDFEHRDAANAANNDVQRRRPAAGNDDFIIPNKITLALNERIRAIMDGAITGELQMSIFVVEVK